MDNKLCKKCKAEGSIKECTVMLNDNENKIIKDTKCVRCGYIVNTK